jgi:hypothetical protein
MLYEWNLNQENERSSEELDRAWNWAMRKLKRERDTDMQAKLREKRLKKHAEEAKKVDRDLSDKKALFDSYPMEIQLVLRDKRWSETSHDPIATMLQVANGTVANDEFFKTESKREYQVVCRRKITRRV